MTTRSIALLFYLITTLPLFAQITDTTALKNGVYGVFQRNKHGEPQNPVVYYDTTGLLKYSASFQNQQLNGPVIYFDEDGRKTMLTEYKDGLLHGDNIYYYPDGSIQVIWPYRQGDLHGISYSYHPNGKIEWTKAYRNGKFFGERILRDSTGTLFNGDYTTVFPMGHGQYTVTCINGRPHGELKVLGRNDRLGYTGNYNNGLPDGEFVFYGRTGNVIYRDYYKNGKFVNGVQAE